MHNFLVRYGSTPASNWCQRSNFFVFCLRSERRMRRQWVIAKYYKSSNQKKLDKVVTFGEYMREVLCLCWKWHKVVFLLDCYIPGDILVLSGAFLGLTMAGCKLGRKCFYSFFYKNNETGHEKHCMQYLKNYSVASSVLFELPRKWNEWKHLYRFFSVSLVIFTLEKCLQKSYKTEIHFNFAYITSEAK